MRINVGLCLAASLLGCTSLTAPPGSIASDSGTTTPPSNQFRFDETRCLAEKFERCVGVAIDFEGYVWIVAQNDDAIYKFDPLSESFYRVPVGRGPYTYSDMTGVQLLNVGLN